MEREIRVTDLHLSSREWCCDRQVYYPVRYCVAHYVQMLSAWQSRWRYDCRCKLTIFPIPLPFPFSFAGRPAWWVRLPIFPRVWHLLHRRRSQGRILWRGKLRISVSWGSSLMIMVTSHFCSFCRTSFWQAVRLATPSWLGLLRDYLTMILWWRRDRGLEIWRSRAEERQRYRTEGKEEYVRNVAGFCTKLFDFTQHQPVGVNLIKSPLPCWAPLALLFPSVRLWDKPEITCNNISNDATLSL